MYQHLSGFDAYRINLSLIQHFKNPKFNFLDGMRVRFTEQTYMNQSDRVFFERVAEHYPLGNAIQFLLVGVLNGCTHITQYSDREYQEWRSLQTQLLYHLERDLNELYRIVKPYNIPLGQVFQSSNGALPVALQCVFGKRIKIETVCILDKLTKGSIMENMERTTTDTFRFPQISLKIKKYEGFLTFNEAKAKEIISKFIN